MRLFKIFNWFYGKNTKENISKILVKGFNMDSFKFGVDRGSVISAVSGNACEFCWTFWRLQGLRG